MSKLAISVVDDDASVRKALSRLIVFAGHTVATFDCAEAFLEAVAAETSDCVILDVHLPGKSGLELQAELVASHASCSVIFITAYADESAQSLALQAGAVEFLRKPLDTERLLDALRSVNGSRGG